jgi:ADP-heptose:LPS heptosyltransferase
MNPMVPEAESRMQRILIIKLSALGDVVQAEGAMHDIRLHHPDAEITVMTTPPFQRYMERCPWVDRIFIDPRDSRFRLDRMLVLRGRLRQQHFDMVYDLQQVGRTNFYYRFFLKNTPWMGGIPGCSCFCKRPDDRCAADHFALSLARAGVQIRYTLQSDVSWLADDVDELLEGAGLTGPFVVLIPGGSANHPEKRWPHYPELAEMLHAYGLRVVTVPGPDEMEVSRSIKGEMLLNGDGSYLDIFKLAGVLRKAAFVVGNDTGPTHIAVHMQIQGLALFSNHIPAAFSGIQHGRFDWIERPDLADLTVSEVGKRLAPLLVV